jgi:hypothetical protein
MFLLKQTIAALLVLSCSFSIAQQTTSNASANQNEKEPANILERRAEYFARQHGGRTNQISVVPRLNALKQLEQMRQREQQLLQSSPQLQTGTAAGFSSLAISTTQWTSIGPAPLDAPGGPFSGRVSALAVDPTNSAVVYLGAADGGVWKTTDGGLHWTPMTDSQPSLSVGAIALDPTNPSIVYLATGEGNGSGDNFPGVGILKSTDGGQTWTNIQGPFVGQFIGSIAVDPSNPQIVLATAFVLPFASELFRSTDGGMTWTGNQNLTFTSVLFDPSHPGVAYAGGVDTSFAVFKSTDDGVTWTAIEHVSGTTGRTKLTLSGSTLYAAFGSNCAPASCIDGATLVKSTDGGTTWAQLNPPTNSQFCPGQCTYGLTIAVSPTNPNLVFFGAINQIHSSDGGTTWIDDTALHVDYHAQAFSADGAKLYVGNDGGAWSTNNPSAGASVTWTNLNATLATLQFYFGISMAAGNPGIGLGGTQDNSTALYSGNPAWTRECSGDAFSTVIDPANSNIMYCANEFGGIFKSTDGFTSAPTEISPPNRNSTFETLLTLDPSDPSRLYTLGGGSTFVQQSNNGGSTWQQISPALPFIFSIDVAPSDSNTIYLATQRGLAVTRNATAGTGATWQTFTAPDFGGFSQVAVDPHDPTTAYAVRSSLGFAAHVFKVTNSGATFTNITGNLPNVSANDIVVDPDQANTLYVATDIGVFSTTSGGTTWNTLVSGLPTSAVTGLIMDRTTRVLRAGTHGRSVWDLQLPPATGGVGNGTLSGTVVNISNNAAISGATVSFSGGTTTTNASGFYQFTNVVPGTYSVTASHTGFFSSTQSATVNSGSTTILNFKLATGGKLAGTVTNSSGTAISGATVVISGGSVPTSVTLTTSSTGAYATNFVPVGTYTITVSATGFTTQSKTATVNTGQTTTVNFTLSSGAGNGTLSGTVVNISTNAAISGATVSFSGGSTTTNSSGFYQFTNVAAGTYHVTASHTGYFSSTQTASVSAGATTTLNFKLATGGKLAGTVKNSSGAAISGATVKISGGSIPTSVTLTTSSTGAYATNFIPVGTYTITVSATGFTSQSKTATVNTGQTTTVNFVL